MVGDAPDFNQVPLVRANDAADVFVEPFDEFITDSLPSVFRAENDMVGQPVNKNCLSLRPSALSLTKLAHREYLPKC